MYGVSYIEGASGGSFMWLLLYHGLITVPYKRKQTSKNTLIDVTAKFFLPAKRAYEDLLSHILNWQRYKIYCSYFHNHNSLL